jgi:predicted RNase H-like nuclease
MHHYRCHHVYIASSASERIVDNLEFFPHNSTMPHISSIDRLLMAANDMTEALKHSHPDVPFATVGYETITALSKLATIFKK